MGKAASAKPAAKKYLILFTDNDLPRTGRLVSFQHLQNIRTRTNVPIQFQLYRFTVRAHFLLFNYFTDNGKQPERKFTLP